MRFTDARVKTMLSSLLRNEMENSKPATVAWHDAMIFFQIPLRFPLFFVFSGLGSLDSAEMEAYILRMQVSRPFLSKSA